MSTAISLIKQHVPVRVGGNVRWPRCQYLKGDPTYVGHSPTFLHFITDDDHRAAALQLHMRPTDRSQLLLWHHYHLTRALRTWWCRRINHQTLSENYICCYDWLCCSRALRTATGWLSTLQFPYWDGVRFDPVRLHVVRQTSSCLPEETHRKAYEVHINSTRSLLYTVSADNWTTSTRQGKNVRM